MKNILKFIGSSLFLILVFESCKKDEHKVYYEGGTAPTLTSSVTGNSIPLSFLNKDQRAILLSWTNPNYMFTTGVSSQDVSYQIEIDTAGSNFTYKDRKVITLSNDLSLDINQNTFNDYLLNQLQLKPGIPHNLEIRLKSTLANSTAVLYSNVLKYTATPYSIPPKVEPPASGTLWATGDAFSSGWANPLGTPYATSQKFTQSATNPNVYELTVNMPGGGGYKLIQEQGNWDTQYHMLAGGTWSGGDFEKKNSDPQFPGPPSSGSYKITVDFQRGKYTVVKL
jgi:starch-binding outer membrane protein SusE/F